MRKLRGIFTVAVTSFNEDCSFNIEAAKNNIDYKIGKGIHGLCILGATRERPDDVIELANYAKLNGADSVMVLPPL